MPIKPLEVKYKSNGCIEPTSHSNHDGKGYPVYIRDGKVRRMYRHRFEKKHGPVPPGLVVRHTCDNRKCINVKHLLLGTRADNMYDRTARGRGPKGSINGRSKIIEADALFILRSKAKPKALAKKFGITRDAVYAIKSGKRWTHLKAWSQPLTLMRKSV